MNASTWEKQTKQRLRGQRVIDGAPCDPVNQVAGRVTSKGIHFAPVGKPCKHYVSDEPLPLRQELPNSPNWQDFTGFKKGKFTVVGLAANRNGQWVVKCQCGTYETRVTKALRNPNNAFDACVHCQRDAYLRKEARRMCFQQPPKPAGTLPTSEVR